ncbi:MAG: hypothetical protein DSZ31_02385 [Gammaproteobacteria bacterium]|nr:MAG: hypothetical protein DSZ31_02385 [Gammaproteobacteria bacterium]
MANETKNGEINEVQTQVEEKSSQASSQPQEQPQEVENKETPTETAEEKKKPTLQLEHTYGSLVGKTLAELQKIGKEIGLSKVKSLKKGELIKRILEKEAEKHGNVVPKAGVLFKYYQEYLRKTLLL